MDSREGRERSLGWYENQNQNQTHSNSRPGRFRSRVQAARPRGNRHESSRSQGRKTYARLPDSDGQVAALVNGIVEKSCASVKMKLGRGGGEE
jgi:hypothetical protein